MLTAAVAQVPDDILDTWRSFLNAHSLITRRVSADLVAAGLPELGWYDVLWALYRQADRRLRVNELAREVVLSPTGMSRFVDRLEQAGVVRREADPGDRRALQVVMTKQGVALLRRMWPVYAAAINRYFAPYVADEAPRLKAALDEAAQAARPESNSQR